MNLSDEESNSEISRTFPLCNFEIKLSQVFPDIWPSFKFHTGVPVLCRAGEIKMKRGGVALIIFPSKMRKTLLGMCPIISVGPIRVFNTVFLSLCTSDFKQGFSGQNVFTPMLSPVL